MKKSGPVGFLAVISVVALTATPGEAWHHWHGGVFIGVGPVWWGPPPVYVAPPPMVIIDQPPVYVQQPPASASSADRGYWYYCPSAKGYYPYVQTCPEQWVPVLARPPQ
jgi:hypothetical protein